MTEFISILFEKLRPIAVRALMAACLMLLPFLVYSALISPSAQAAGADSDSGSDNAASMEDSPNVITSGMFRAVDKLEQSTRSAGQSISNSLQSVSRVAQETRAKSGSYFVSGVSSSLHSAGSGVSYIANGAGSGVYLAAHTTSDVFGYIVKSSVVEAVIKPSDKIPVPAIDTDPAQEQAIAELLNKNAVANPSQPETDSGASWPVHGEITTEFGVPEPPYQAIHTGIDISDAHLGTTPVHPFKAGVVIQVIRSSLGLGNHVIIDHGGGLTSVYGHLATVSVAAGQKVDKNTMLGLEGSTGASTGAHVHFEIRLNGLPVNPHRYISGQP
jgi:murein DD-endopeptidase MepM/ murein hydrolase activator NlpD